MFFVIWIIGVVCNASSVVAFGYVIGRLLKKTAFYETDGISALASFAYGASLFIISFSVLLVYQQLLINTQNFGPAFQYSFLFSFGASIGLARRDYSSSEG